MVCAFSVCVASAQEEDFEWSWESGKKDSIENVDRGPQTTDRGRVTDVSVEKTEQRTRTAEAPGIDADAYNELLEENLELRRKIDETADDKGFLKKENERLKRELGSVEGKTAQLAKRIKDLEKGSDKNADSDQVGRLETKLAEAQAEKERLRAEIERLRVEPPAEVDSPVKKGSDLYNALEKENADLRSRLRELKEQREKVEKSYAEALAESQAVAAQEMELKSKIEALSRAESERAETVKKILKRVPAMEKQLTRLKDEVSEKDEKIEDSRKIIRLLRDELEKREERLEKAEGIAGLLESAEDDLQRIEDIEKRDMHYNMAVIYGRAGRQQEAEAEYLRALNLDPNDADAHFNLGILYDEQFRDKRRALIHYKKYLKLSPGAGDSDQVRHWILNLETRQ